MDDYLRRNRTRWNDDSDTYQQRHSGQLDSAGMAWGTYSIPDTDVGALGDVAGKRALELGCGGAQFGRAVAAAGAEVFGLDMSEVQLTHARRNAPGMPLVQASGDAIPFADASFDLVFCDHGAIGWGDPATILPEAARVLKPGGRLAFNISTRLFAICWDDDLGALGTRLIGDYFGDDRHDDEEDVYFAPTISRWVRLLRSSGLRIENMIELRPPEGATSTYADSFPYEWCSRWPGEHIWVATKPRA